MTEDDTGKLRDNLTERVKELRFLHHAARLLNMRGEQRETVQQLLDLLPTACRYPDRATARIAFGDLDMADASHASSPVTMRADFELEDARRGFVELGYAATEAQNACFLPEEHKLLESCAELLESYFERAGARGISRRLMHAEAAQEAALSDSRAKDRILGTVSHELRSSLHVMTGWVEVLKQQSADHETASRGLQILERNIALQARLIEDLLDLSRVISGKLALDMHPVDLRELVGFAVDAARPAAEAKQIALTVHLEDVGNVVADPQRLQQVVYNILGNAVKFTPSGGSIDVSLAKVETNARIRVKDTGIGIAPELLPHIFERFRQAETTSSGRSGGLGLGLAIARHLVEMQNGTIRASSDRPGEGSTFEITLPLSATFCDPSSKSRHET